MIHAIYTVENQVTNKVFMSLSEVYKYRTKLESKYKTRVNLELKFIEKMPISIIPEAIKP